MDKLKMHSVNKVNENIEKIGALFPNALTEVIKGYRKDGKAIIEQAIDFDILRQELSGEVVEGPEERYQFTWPDKRKSILLANAPIAKTLRPCREESVDFDNTENLYIEGDNLDALKLLQETYLGKVKMIYIDPPYNTGNDFVYEDDLAQDVEEYLANSGQFDEEGNQLFQNTESNGRFHSDWLNMIYPRIKLAKDLLSDDGIIFISIDDNEVENLKKICNEIFGANNYVEQLIWKRRATPPNDRVIGKNHEYIIAFAKNLNIVSLYLQPRNDELNTRYKNPDNDPRGMWVASDLSANGKGGRLVESCIYPITNPITNKDYYPPDNKCWLYNKEKVDKLIEDQRIGFRQNSGAPFLKRYLSEVRQGSTLPTIIDNVGFSFDSAKEIKDLFKKDVFEFPKPIKLIKTLLQTGAGISDVILDFFSGSATTAHAVMQLNAQDGGNRKFIMVQLPEATDENSEANKAGYKNICEIGKERIRRAGNKIKNEAGMYARQLDVGFRVLKVDSTNIEDVYYSPTEYNQDQIEMFADNIKPDRSPEDLLFQVMLDLGVLLSSKIEEITIGGKNVFNVADGYLLACFDSNVTDEVITEIARKKPYYAVFRDSSMASDSVAANFEQIFTTYSPTTVRKVL